MMLHHIKNHLHHMRSLSQCVCVDRWFPVCRRARAHSAGSTTDNMRVYHVTPMQRNRMVIVGFVQIFFLVLLLWWFFGKEGIASEMTNQQEARARVLHYFNPQFKPFVVLVTCFEKTELLDSIYQHTLNNWKGLTPTITPVVYFAQNTTLTRNRMQQLKDLNWDVRFTEKTINSVPIMKHMMIEARESYPTAEFLMYANPRLLLDESLVFTIKEIQRVEKEKDMADVVRCMIGRSVAADTSHVEHMQYTDNVRKVAYEMGNSLSSVLNLDYFVCSRNFEWHLVPDIVPLASKATNLLVVWAAAHDCDVYDLTSTALSIRQHDSDVLEAESNYGTVESAFMGMNAALAGPYGYNVDAQGRSDCAKWYTQFVEKPKPLKYVTTYLRNPTVCGAKHLKIPSLDDVISDGA